MATDAARVGIAPSYARGAVGQRSGVRPIAVVRFATACMIVGNLGRLPIFSSGGKAAPLLVNDVAIGLVLFVGLVACLQARTLRLDLVAAFALAFAGVGAASALLAASKFGLTGVQVAFGLAYLVRWLAYFGVYLVLVNAAAADDMPALWRTVERTVLAFAVFGIVQSIFLPGFAQLVFPEDATSVRWDHQGHRMVSTLLDPNFAGAFVLVPLLVLLARLSYGERIPRWKLVVLGASLLMTVSRSSILALCAGLTVLALVRGLNRRLARLAVGAGLALLPVLPLLVRFAASFDKFRIDDSAMLRLVSWAQAIAIFADNVWLGVGFNTYGFVQRAYGFEAVTENSSFGLDGGLLFIAVMTGVVGVVLYSAMLWAVVRRCRVVWRDAAIPPDVRGTALGTAAASLAIVVHSVFVNSLLLPFTLQLLWTLWGMVFVHAAARRASIGAATP